MSFQAEELGRYFRNNMYPGQDKEPFFFLLNKIMIISHMYVQDFLRPFFQHFAARCYSAIYD
jgi:hypothetical protein